MKLDEALLFFALLSFAWFMGVHYERDTGLKPCVETAPRQWKMPATKEQVRRMSKYLEGRTQ